MGRYSNFYKKYRNELGITENIQAYIQSRILKKTLESMTFDQRRGIGKDDDEEKEFITGMDNRLVKALQSLPLKY